MRADDRLKQLLSQPPGALSRLGAETFLPITLYRSAVPVRAVYINRGLFHRLLSPDEALDFDAMADVINRHFSFTIEQSRSDGTVAGQGYADYQKDPLDLSLSGNLGSGRAYYTGGVFNIKGEKTPLATSSLRKFSDGLLEMERCIWESVISGALQGSFANGLNDVLAVLDMGEKCEVGWRDHPVQRGKIIRIDLSGELDRVTHLFHRPRALAAEEWQDVAQRYGHLEADKFIERIIHGTWSPGNISLKGHLLDFDTVGAVKGRSPQYSSSRWFYHNYFGYEHHGQMKVIETMTDDATVNAAGVAFDTLRAEMDTARENRTARGLAFLMGFPDPDAVYARYHADLHALLPLWQNLSRKYFKNTAAMSTKHPLAACLHAFDFSALFRIYPLQKRTGCFSPADMLRMIAATPDIDTPFAPPADDPLTAEEQPYHDAVTAMIGEHIIATEDDFNIACIAALGFIRKYDALHARIAADTGADMMQVEARAYVVNEDRHYLFPVFTPTFVMAENTRAHSPATLHRMTGMLIAANRRHVPDKAPYICDIRLYHEGSVYRLLDGTGGYRVCFMPWQGQLNADTLRWHGRAYAADPQETPVDGAVMSRTRPFAALAEDFARDDSLHIESASLEAGQSVTAWQNLLDTDRTVP
jgi:hypothetical protein